MPNSIETKPNTLALGDVCSRTFLYLTTFRQQCASGSLGLNEALNALRAVWREEELAAQTSPDVHALYRKARYLLVVCADELIRLSEWAEAARWPSQESAEFGTTEGGDRFFQLMEDPAYHHPALREVFFQCLALGFQGQHLGDRAVLRDMRRSLRLGLEDVPRDRAEYLVPDAYKETQGEDYTSLPVASTVRLVLVLLGVVMTLGVLARVSYGKSVKSLKDTATSIVREEFSSRIGR